MAGGSANKLSTISWMMDICDSLFLSSCCFVILLIGTKLLQTRQSISYRAEYFPVLGPNLGCVVLRGDGYNGVAESW